MNRKLFTDPDRRAAVSRYLEIEEWAKARYLRPDGSIVTRGPGWHKPTRYSMIEDYAAREYLDCAPRFPTFTLATATTGA